MRWGQTYLLHESFNCKMEDKSARSVDDDERKNLPGN